jgi:hypothetical protein
VVAVNRRELLAAALAGTTTPLATADTAGDDRTPIGEMPDYCAVADDRQEAVCAWVGEHVQNARVALNSPGNRDPAEAKAELKTALDILERELSD